MTQPDTPDFSAEEAASEPDTGNAGDLNDADDLDGALELNADDADFNLPGLVGEAETSVSSLLEGIMASSNMTLFEDISHLSDSAAIYDAGVEWLNEHLHALRVCIALYQNKTDQTAAELDDLIRMSDELAEVGKALKKMRRELGWAEKRFRRKYHCRH